MIDKSATMIKFDYIMEAENGLGSDIRDDFHSMSELYFNRMVLFSIICNSHPYKAFKTIRHHPDDIPMTDGFFYVEIFGNGKKYGYHYQMKFWDYFKIPTRIHADKYDFSYRKEDIGVIYEIIKEE